MSLKRISQIIIVIAMMLLVMDQNRISLAAEKYDIYNPTEEDIVEEMKAGDIELVAQVVRAEAGNQDLKGKMLVADVIYNRVKSPRFPNTVEEVIFQKGQFGVTTDGALEKAAWHVTQEDFLVAASEYEDRIDAEVLFFNTVHQNGKNPFKHGAHWFSY